MAACLITIGGTSGILELNYKISGVPHSIQTSVGTLYIEDTATDVTYTKLSGDVTASSGCLTITSLPVNYYKIGWKGVTGYNYNANAVELGSTVYTIPDTAFPLSYTNLATSVNGLDISNIKVVAYKTTHTSISSLQESEFAYIFRIVGTDIPRLRVKNADNTWKIYVIGETSTALPTGYTAIDVCDTPIIS